jgi:acyl-CoA dehydrogenase
LIGDVAAVTTALGQHCASTAMIYAMHQIQVACLVRHGDTPYLRALLGEVAAKELLLASATTEAGVGGDVRSSVCAVEAHGDRFRLEKNAPVISYGEHADAILATARRTMDSAPNDQVLVVVRRLAETLEPTSGWDTLGFRGTCSLGFKLRAQGDLGQVLPDPYADISARTMLPVSHIVWSSVWLGIATSAVNKAGAYVRAEARKKPGTTPPAALRLAEVTSLLQQLRSLVRDAIRQYQSLMEDPDALSSLGFALQMNNLKVSASTLVVDIVSRSMIICGMAGYREDSPFSLGRELRDAYGAALMINNDRINGNNATMLLVHKDL